MKLLVCGSRTWSDYNRVEKELDKLVEEIPLLDFELVTGGCPKGADHMAAIWAVFLRSEREVKKLPGKIIITSFLASWSLYGKKAGPIRNSEMASYVGRGGICVAFRAKGKSSGTDDMIRKATTMGMKVFIHKM